MVKIVCKVIGRHITSKHSSSTDYMQHQVCAACNASLAVVVFRVRRRDCMAMLACWALLLLFGRIYAPTTS